jgi:hypothetical protein
VFSREQLLDSVWGRDVYIDERTIDVHIGRLRKLLNPGREQDPIRTVRGAGSTTALRRWSSDGGETYSAVVLQSDTAAVAATKAVVARLGRAIQYAAASRVISDVSGILGRPVKPGDDSRVGVSDEAPYLAGFCGWRRRSLAG